MRKIVSRIVLIGCAATAASSATAGTTAVAGTKLAFRGTGAPPDTSGTDAMWKRVRRLEPGARITVTVSGAAPASRYFVQLDDAELVVLNLGAPSLPARQLLNMAIDHPDWMAATGKTIYKDNSLRVGPEGVFVKDKKVAELGQVVEHLNRSRVSDVETR
jgi:hypothetical protein